MIKAEIVYTDKQLESLRVKGHAETAEYGKDLVCAGVSAVVIGALNALEDEDNFDISIEEGDVKVDVKGTLSEHDVIVFEILIIQLKTIKMSHPKAIDIKERKSKQ